MVRCSKCSVYHMRQFCRFSLVLHDLIRYIQSYDRFRDTRIYLTITVKLSYNIRGEISRHIPLARTNLGHCVQLMKRFKLIDSLIMYECVFKQKVDGRRGFGADVTNNGAVVEGNHSTCLAIVPYDNKTFSYV